MQIDPAALPLPAENIYGHRGRVDWMLQHIGRDDRILEVGCGTGYRITYLLHRLGYDVHGLDTDETSVRYGQDLLERAGEPRDLVSYRDLREVDDHFDVIILSEVLEHLPDEIRTSLLGLARERLRPKGRLLVTVPNGYGWYEMEDFLWDRTGIGWLLEKTKLAAVLRRIKGLFVSGPTVDRIASSLETSPHVQRFTYDSIKDALSREGFEVVDATGSVLFSGPFSDLFFTGARRIERFNRRMGRRFPRRAAGFYVASVRP